MNLFADSLIANKKNPIIPDELNYFGSLVGQWDFEWRDNVGTEKESINKGEWTFSWVLEGKAIQDTFIVPSRKIDTDQEREYGTTIRIFNPIKQCWDVFYGCTGEASLLEARKEGDKIVLTSVANNEYKMKWIFSDITENSFNWRHIRSFDEGKTWQVKAKATAKKCHSVEK